MKTWLAAALVTLIPSLAVAQETTGFNLVYDLHAKGLIVGRTELTLSSKDGKQYAYTSVSSTVGLAALVRDDRIVESSRFAVSDGQLLPSRYSYERKGKRKQRTVQVEFDWNRQQVQNTSKGRTWKMSVQPRTLDKLNYILAVMADLSVEQRELRYSVADGGKLKVFRVERLRTETIETVLGPTETVVIQRSRKGGKRVTTLWCAEALGYAPIQIRHQETDGEVLMLKLSSHNGEVRSPAKALQHALR